MVWRGAVRVASLHTWGFGANSARASRFSRQDAVASSVGGPSCSGESVSSGQSVFRGVSGAGYGRDADPGGLPDAELGAEGDERRREAGYAEYLPHRYGDL